MKHLPLLATALVLGACSASGDRAGNSPAAAEAADRIDAVEAPATPPPLAATLSVPKVLGLEGLGDLRIGQPVPVDRGWTEEGAQPTDACRTLTSPTYPGVYAIGAGGKVRRITVGQRSDVRLAEGIGVGATEQEVTKWFAGFRAEPHKYVEAPAKYLTAPNASNGGSALRFEIGNTGKVDQIHVGMMPELAYVEGCS